MISRIKENLNDTTIVNLMYTLGANSHIDSDEYIIFPTICHNSCNGSMKLYYYKNSKNFNCFTNCHSHDIVELVQKVLDVNFSESINFLSKFLGLRDIYIPKGFGSSNVIVQDFEDDEIDIQVIENKNILNNFLDYNCCEWLNENISSNTMKKYNIKYQLEHHKIVIPHYNIHGELVGIRGRALLSEDVERGRKYMPIYLHSKPYVHSLRHNLYGLNINLDAIKKYKQVVVFESEKSVLKMDSIYNEDNIAVAIGGSNISKHHINLLLDCGVKECVLALDKQFKVVGDEEYIQWKKKLLKVVGRFSELIKITVIWHEGELLEYRDSPIDQGQETFEYLFNSRVSFQEDEC